MSAQWVDFADIRRRVPLEFVLFQLYALTNLERRGNRVTGPCPLHGGNNPKSFRAELDRNIWFCHSRCKRGGNQIDYVALKEGISIRDAALKLQAAFLESNSSLDAQDGSVPVKPAKKEVATPDIVARPPKVSESKPALRPERNPELRLSLDLDQSHPHLLEVRKLKKETIAEFGVGYCRAGTLRGMIAIPIHDETGMLVAYAGRRLKEEDIEKHGKYKLPKGFHKELVLYSFHRAKEAMHSTGLILVEGFFTAMKLYEYGFTNVVAAMGSDVSEAQTELLAQSPEVIILFDGDEAGRRGGEAASEALKARTKARLIGLPSDTEPEDHDARALRWAVNGVRQVGIMRLSFSLSK